MTLQVTPIQAVAQLLALKTTAYCAREVILMLLRGSFLVPVLPSAPCPRCMGRETHRGLLSSVDILVLASLARASSWPPIYASGSPLGSARARKGEHLQLAFGTPQRDVGGEFAGARRRPWPREAQACARGACTQPDGAWMGLGSAVAREILL